MSLTVILAEVEHPGNIGSVARAMANFGVKELILIDPKCSITQESHNLAKNAQGILNNARTASWKVLEEFRVVAATTGTIGTDYNLPRTPLTPEQGAEKLAHVKGAAILFGCESRGLTNAQLKKADFVITIPTHHAYSSMNLSHAVAVMLAAYYRCGPAKPFTPISAKEKEILEKRWNALLDRTHYPTEGKRETQRKLWKNIFGRATLTRREAFAALGFLSALEKEFAARAQREAPKKRARR